MTKFEPRTSDLQATTLPTEPQATATALVMEYTLFSLFVQVESSEKD